MHIHLDKTFYGGKWEAPRPRKGKTIMDMIAREQVLIPKLYLPTSVRYTAGRYRPAAFKGTTVARSQLYSIDPVSGLKSLEHLKSRWKNISGISLVRSWRFLSAVAFASRWPDARSDADGRAIRRRTGSD